MQQHQLPREKIPWFPTIAYDACIGDRECLDFCKNGVFSWDEPRGAPRGRKTLQLRAGVQRLRPDLSRRGDPFSHQRRAAADDP